MESALSLGLLLTISILTCIGIIVAVIIKPKVQFHRISLDTYWIVALSGALLLLVLGLVSPASLFAGLTADTTINPLKILVLFLSMTFLSLFLDELGFFQYVADKTVKFAGTSQIRLFFAFYLVISLLTIFTSNDIIILTFTPFICYFAKYTCINPIPYLVLEFVAANTWSMMLIIGNPTNIYLAGSAGFTFGAYTKVMAFPTLMAGLAAYGMLYLTFRKELSKPLQVESTTSEIENPLLMWIGVAHLGLCTLLLVISSYINLEMWLITFAFACSLFICAGLAQYYQRKRIHSKKPQPRTHHILLHTINRAPWELIPFVLSMFLIVLSLEKFGVTNLIAGGLGEAQIIFRYGVSSFLTANVMNNIPMAVLYSSITSHLATASPAGHIAAVFASIVGSNLGAFFTPLGALAGIMWSGILKKLDVEFSFTKYIRYGAPISFVTLAFALAGLWIVL